MTTILRHSTSSSGSSTWTCPTPSRSMPTLRVQPIPVRSSSSWPPSATLLSRPTSVTVVSCKCRRVRDKVVQPIYLQTKTAQEFRESDRVHDSIFTISAFSQPTLLYQHILFLTHPPSYKAPQTSIYQVISISTPSPLSFTNIYLVRLDISIFFFFLSICRFPSFSFVFSSDG